MGMMRRETGLVGRGVFGDSGGAREMFVGKGKGKTGEVGVGGVVGGWLLLRLLLVGLAAILVRKIDRELER